VRRLLAADLDRSELSHRLETLMDGLGAAIPRGMGKGAVWQLSGRSQLEEVMVGGSRYAVEQGHGIGHDLERSEDYGAVAEADPGQVSVDQHPVCALGADAAVEPLRVAVRTGRSWGSPDHSDVFGGEHRVEGLGGLRVAVADEKPKRCGPVRVHDQIPGLLGAPGRCWMGGDAQYGQVIDVLVSARRDAGAARRFFRRALSTLKVTPCEVVTDAAAVYPGVLDELIPQAWHHVERYANNPRLRRAEPGLTAGQGSAWLSTATLTATGP
jgi:hypothetical protein